MRWRKLISDALSFRNRFEAEPVADLAMHLRQRPPTPVRPRGKKLAAGAPGGLVLAGLATPAGPGSVLFPGGPRDSAGSLDLREHAVL